MLSLLLFLSLVACVPFEPRQNSPQHSQCRFSLDFTQNQILQNSTEFEQNIFYWEGQYHQDGVGYDKSTGVTIDHILLGYATGLPAGPPTMISNARNEAYHIMLLAHALSGNSYASTFIDPANPQNGTALALSILTAKLTTYANFTNTHPGYAGFLPTFQIGNSRIQPVAASNHTVSALDNGYLIWAILSLVHVLYKHPILNVDPLYRGWYNYLAYLRDNAKVVFLKGSQLGSICATSTLLPQIYPPEPAQKYACEDDTDTLKDPYSGDLMAWWLYYTNMGIDQAHAIMTLKRPQLQAVNYTGSIVNTPSKQRGSFNYTGPVSGQHLVPVTTQKGLYFGAQEHLKLLFLPYLNAQIVDRVMKNAERVRTCNSVLMGGTPGLFAAVTDAISPEQDSTTYVANAGIPSAAENTFQQLDMITPYAAFATILHDKGIGLAWYKNMLDAKCMQSIYGSVAGIRRDGSAVSRVVSWETKAPILLALLDYNRLLIQEGLQDADILEDFLKGVATEYSMVFEKSWNGGSPLMGEDVPFCLPSGKVSGLGLNDYSSCTWKGGSG